MRQHSAAKKRGLKICSRSILPVRQINIWQALTRVNVTWMKKGFNAYQTHHITIFNCFPVIQPLSSKVRNFSTFFAYFCLLWLRPWDNRGKYHMDGKRIQCNCQTHRSWYPSIFNRFWDIASYWSKISTFSYPTSVYRPHRGDPVGISRRFFLHTTLEWMGYRVVKKAWQYVQPFWYNTSVWRTDRQTDRIGIAKTCFSIADARKNSSKVKLQPS